MGNATFAGVVMDFSVILVCDFLSRPVGCCRDSGLAFAPADDFDAQMVDGDMGGPLSVVFVMVECYTLSETQMKMRLMA